MQLSLKEGVAVTVLKREDNWWLVDVNGVRGYVPAEAVRELQARDHEFAEAAGVKHVWTEAAAAGQGKQPTKGDVMPWTCGLWAYLASFYAGGVCCLLGAAGALSHLRAANQYPEAMQDLATAGRRFVVALFSLFFGLGLLGFSWWSKLASSSDQFTTSGVPLRALFFMACAMPLFASGFTFLAGVSVGFVSLLCYLSAWRRESRAAPENAKTGGQTLRNFFLPPDLGDMAAGNKHGRELSEVPRFSPIYWRLWWELQGVRGERSKAFIYTHVTCASIFMVCLWWHAPHFYLWACGPVGLYLMDRYLRYNIVSLATAKLLEVRWRPSVLQLVFDKPWKYKAGQYVWLCCPGVARFEKHPFTIASAPETEELCLAIKCWPGGWTEKLRDFLAEECNTAPGKRDGATFRFEEEDWLTGHMKRGTTCMQDCPGKPLLQIDGPHAAPAMRYCEFGVVIFAAAGIGLTPASSTLRSLLQFRWRREPNAWPHSMYFVWLCAAVEVPAFEWFMDELADLEVAAQINALKYGDETSPARQVQMHLFITRAPPADDRKAQKPPRNPKQVKLFGSSAPSTGKRPYSPGELQAWMNHPSTKSDEMQEVLAMPWERRPNQAGHTLVWNGRPQWDALFGHVKQAHRGKSPSVGVFFCGAPAIGKDLKRSCHSFSDAEINFRLMKESF